MREKLDDNPHLSHPLEAVASGTVEPMEDYLPSQTEDKINNSMLGAFKNKCSEDNQRTFVCDQDGFHKLFWLLKKRNMTASMFLCGYNADLENVVDSLVTGF